MIRRYGVLGTAAFAFAVLARAVFVVLPPDTLFGSGRRYVDPAAELLAGHWAAPSTIDQLPGAPLVFALCFAVFGENYALTAFIQHLLGLVSFLLIVELARRAWGVRAAGLTAALLCVQLILPYQECFLLSESAGQLFLAVALYLAFKLKLDAPRELLPWAAAGACAALAALTRGEMLAVGPVLGAALAVARPKKRTALAAYAAGWLVLIGGWSLRNRALGFSGFNAHGPTVLLESPDALDRVRFDLPTEPVVKQVLKEQIERCRAAPIGCDPRPTTLDRLVKEHGMGYIEARAAYGRVATEAVLSHPGELVARVARHAVSFFVPMPWVSEDQSDPRSVTRVSRARGPAHEALWRLLEGPPQRAGWVALLPFWLLPLALWLSPRGTRWEAGALALCAAGIAAVASLDLAYHRFQAQLYFPVCAASGFALDVLWRRLKPR